ncbi:uncharacterized protein LOC123942196 [Meles meles]|uniref:uncharacterized protein LOC123942196 n=1 Tax=Meles meles TaxID=9662 RepID=UPI001E698ACB|nr:uncharacterized protein LOC123942196 [Meles meles]
MLTTLPHPQASIAPCKEVSPEPPVPPVGKKIPRGITSSLPQHLPSSNPNQQFCSSADQVRGIPCPRELGGGTDLLDPGPQMRSFASPGDWFAYAQARSCNTAPPIVENIFWLHKIRMSGVKTRKLFGQDHWRVREPGGGAGSPGFLTERAQLRSRAPGAVLELVPRGGGRSKTASVNALPQSSSSGPAGLRWRRLGRRGTHRDEPISCQASGEATRGRRETHKERGERRRRKGAADSGRQLPAAPAPAAAAGAGSEAAETMRPGFGPARLRVRTPALPWPLFDRPSPRPAPSRLAWPPPWEGAPSRSRSREESPSAAAEPGNLRAGKSLRRLRGAARRGAARPWRPRSQPVTFWTSRQSGPRRARRRLRGGPESVRRRPRPGLRPWRVAVEEG